MAPHKTTNGDQSNGDKHSVSVLVTGFGPFQERFPVNPSFEIARSLSGTLPTPTSDGREVRIIGYGNPIPVSYEEVRELVPVINESYLGSVDLVLHIGMASGRSFYTAELFGNRDGYYRNKDIDGKILPADDGLIHFGDCPPAMTTSLNFDEIVKKWKAILLKIPGSLPGHNADCRPSDDAGHYLCDYIYFNSLAWYGRVNNDMQGKSASARPVLFLHVPAESDPETLEEGREVTLALIGAMVEEWCNSKNAVI